MNQAANEAQAATAMTQEQRTIIQQAHQIAALSTMLENAVNRANQLGAVVKMQADALDSARVNKAKEQPPTAPTAQSTPGAKAARQRSRKH